MSKKHNTVDSFSELLPPMDFGDLRGVNFREAEPADGIKTVSTVRDITAGMVEQVTGSYSELFAKPLFAQGSAGHSLSSSMVLDFDLAPVSSDLPDGWFSSSESTPRQQTHQLYKEQPLPTLYSHTTEDSEDKKPTDTPKKSTTWKNGSDMHEKSEEILVSKTIESQLKDNLPLEIWKILEPVASELIKNGDIYFSSTVSFFFGPKAPKIHEKEFLTYDAKLDSDSYERDTEYEKLIRFGCMLQYFMHELGLSKRKHKKPQRYIDFIEENYIRLDIPNIFYIKNQHIEAWENRKKFYSWKIYPQLREDVALVFQDLISHITDRSKILCRQTWATIEKIKSEEQEKERLRIKEEEDSRIREIEHSLFLEKMEKEEKKKLIHQETEKKQKQAQIAREVEKRQRDALHAKIEALWEEMENENLSPTEKLMDEFRKKNQDFAKIENLWKEVKWDDLSPSERLTLESLRKISNLRKNRE